MTAAGFEVHGQATFWASLDAAAVELADLAPAKAGQLLVSRGEAASPRETGHLAGSHEAVVTAGLVEVVAATDYAAYVHARDPWLARTLDAATDELLTIYADAAADVVATIKGA